jgi:hypothetical protein
MGALQRFERRLGGLVEGAFARVFKGGVEPVELASALRRETDDRRAISATRVLVPNEFMITLSPTDYERLGQYAQALETELGEIVREHAADQRYTFVGPVAVRFEVDEDTDTGVFHVRSAALATADPRPSPSASPAPGAGRLTRRPEEPREAVETPRMVLTTGGSVRAGSAQAAGYEREFPMPGEPGTLLLIGRAPEADIRLADTGVSRRHGQLRRTPRGWVYEDLGSTNGSTINGRRVGTTEMHDGDRLEVGSSVLVYREADHPRGGDGRSGGELSGHPAEA